ncbi:F(420)H(2) dehydrogenase subunit I [uncultured archaeon]|nr:F(420)H(2) dehydrogenase subunit I [uncultured archaeon]
MLKRKMIKNFSWPLKTATREIEITRLYPEVMMELPDAERGIHELDATICIGCGTCARVCPNSCIEMVHFKFGSPLKNKKMQFPQIDYGRCMFCGLCVDDCPVECLKMGKKVTMAGWEREDIVKRPDFLATKRFTANEVADLEAEAKRIAAEKAAAKKAAAGKEGASKKPAKEGAAAPKKKEAAPAAAKPKEGGAA